MSNVTYYRIWFDEVAARPILFRPDELEAMAERYGFDADELLARGETDLIDDEMGVIGGVVVHE